MGGQRVRASRLVRILRAVADTLRGSLRSLGANTLRSSLTLLGIVIGIVAVVAMSATIEGLRRKINEDITSLGSGVFQIQKWPHGFGHSHSAKYAKRKNLTMADVTLLET